jgi:two-component system sensor histidine kinase YesM
MNRLQRLYRDTGLATKQFIFLFIVFAGLFSALVWGNLRDAENIVREQVIGDSQIILDRTNRLLDSYIDTIMGVLMLVRSSQDILLSGNDFEIRKVLYEYSQTSTIVKTLYFIKEADGMMLSSKQGLTEALGNPSLLNMHKDMKQDTFSLQWSEPYFSPVSGNTVAFVLPVRNSNMQKVGTAAVEIDLGLLKMRLTEMIGDTDQTFAVLTRGNSFVSIDMMSPLIPYVVESYRKKLDPAFAGRLTSLSTGVSVVEGVEQSLVAIKSASNRLNWSIVSLIDEHYFYRNITHLNTNYRNAAFLWIFILFISVWIITRIITGPIRKLAFKMDRVQDFDVIQPIYREGNDEIGRLAQSYNRLLSRVHLLIKEIKVVEASKKDYELKMLQNQIGPHFLYNTLTCISSLAKQQKTEEVRETIRSLGGLLHYSFNKSSEFVTLGQELDAMYMYVQIQKIRYGEQFDVVFDIDPGLLDCLMLKLTLQPLVENAIYHGIAPKNESGTIHVIARERGGLLNIYIIDDGVGIAPDHRRLLLNSRVDAHDPQAFNSIGLTNVQERIKLHYGEAYGLRIASRASVGTVVRIRLPKHTNSSDG